LPRSLFVRSGIDNAPLIAAAWAQAAIMLLYFPLALHMTKYTRRRKKTEE
jgi:hypothetical protein